MQKKLINGIQQIGVGVEQVQPAFDWYRKFFGMDIKVFEEAAVAELMKYYTEGQSRARHAILALNMQSGGGFEIWQHTGKKPELPKIPILLGDFGIFSAKLKTQNAALAYKKLKEMGAKVLGNIENSPKGVPSFFVEDPYGNLFQVVQHSYYFSKTDSATGGVLGVIIGVSNMEASLKFYTDLLELDEIVYDKTDVFADFASVLGGGQKMRRVLLKPKVPAQGGFAPMLGPIEIELVQVLDRSAKKIYEGRIWGDPGFIHLCFDISGMSLLRAEASQKGYPFTVDSQNSFDMGEAAGHFAYVSDPDETPIEFVETHRLPLIKSLGIQLNLQKRDPMKPVSHWILRAFALKRVK
jgi:catechol 2,3-dioxygenase-like lactoylglutathione lyase family enzyme